MKKILLIPTYYYLSNPLYSSLKEILDENYSFTYFFSKDSTSLKSNLLNISKLKVGSNFDKYVEIDAPLPWVYNEQKFNIRVRFINGFLKKVNYFFKLKRYVKQFITKINEISPDYIVITSDLTISYRIIKKYFPKVKIIILQPCFLDFRDRELREIPVGIRIINNYFKGILYPNQPYFGLENKSTDKLLLFEDKFFEFYKDKRENIYKIFNPFFVKLNDQIESLDIVKIKNKLSHIINIDLKREIVIIYVSDYTSFHGVDIHNYTIESYIKLIKKFADKYTFIIKNHPRAGVKDFEKNFIGYKQVFFLNNEIEYNELLSIGNLNISINSNASLESIVCGMPTINFLPLHLKENDHFKWLSYYGGEEANTYEDLELLLEKYLDDKNFFLNKLNEGRKKLVGTKEECKRNLLNAFESK
jgi:hypothetical protein